MFNHLYRRCFRQGWQLSLVYRLAATNPSTITWTRSNGARSCEPVALRLPSVGWLRSPVWLRNRRQGVKFRLVKENANHFQLISQESEESPGNPSAEGLR